MSSRVPMACPNCRTPLLVREEYFGRVLECKKCLHPFIPSPADALPEPSAIGSSDVAAKSARVKVECAHCHQRVKVRPRYLGRTVNCCLCYQPFVAALDPAGDSSAKESEPVESGAVLSPELSREIADFRSEFARMADRLGGIESRVDSLQSEVSRPGEGIDQAISGLEEGRREMAGLEARFSAIRGELDELRQRPTSEVEGQAASESLAREVVARLEAERDQAREEFDRQQGELEALRHQNADLTRRAVEFERRSLALESRLGSMEEAQLREVEKSTQLEEKLRELERIAEPSEPAGELDRSIQRLIDEHDSTRRLVEVHEEHRGSLESGLAKLEAAQIAVDQVVADLRDRTQAGDLAAIESWKAIRDDFRRVTDDQDDLQGRLKAAEIEQGLLQDEFQRFRREMDSLKEEAIARSDRDRAEIAALRDELAARPASFEPAATPSTAIVPDPVESPAPPAAPVVELTKATSPFDFDQLAHDLLDLATPPRASAARRTPQVRVQPAANPVELGASPNPGTGEMIAEMDQTRKQFDQSMSEGNLRQSIASARRMVDLSRDRYGARSMKHVLWLRNLGVCLTRQGILAEARTVLLSAWEISRDELATNPMPHAICLVDLGDLHLVEGDHVEAKTVYEKALTILNTLGMTPNHPILLRAQRSLSQLTPNPVNSAGFATISITT